VAFGAHSADTSIAWGVDCVNNAHPEAQGRSPNTMPQSSRYDLTQPILLVGRDGMLGRAWRQLLADEGLTFDAIDIETIDLTRPDTIDPSIDDRYGLVINCTAYTDVDGAETSEALAEQINGAGVGWLAERCRQIGAPLVHYSTDYVFDGRAESPYPPDAPLAPIGAYGRSKAYGEQRLRETTDDHLIIRTSWLYAAWGGNFVLTMMKLLAERDEVRVVDDQRGRPTSAEHLARTSLALVRAGAGGTYHVTDGGKCTWYELAREIARLTGSACRVEPCTSAEFPRPAPRPAYSVLDISATEQLVGAMPHWTDNLADVIRRDRQTTAN
jgi:dTDP-4-dehydrorhamnose reductase